MTNNDCNITKETISKLGLKLSNAAINAEVDLTARIFEYPPLKDVFIMENDLYGNIMPRDSCFLAFYGRNGLIGKHLRVETLLKMSTEDIKNMVQINTEG
jgi:hypothetical protein